MLKTLLSTIRDAYARLQTNSTDAGAERYRRAILTSITGVSAQLVQVATGLISIPITLNYLGIERFGLWITLSTVLTFLTFADLGVGIGMQNKLSICYNNNELSLARKVFYSAFSFLALLFLAFIAFALGVLPILNLKAWIVLQTPGAIAEIIPTSQSVVFILALGLLAGIVQRTYDALQQGYYCRILLTGARIFSLILLFVAVRTEAGLPILAFIIGGVPNLIVLILGMPLLIKKNQWLIPSSSLHENFNRAALRDILILGIYGLGATVAVYFVNSYVPFVISSKYGVKHVADYAVTQRLITIPLMFLNFLLLPLWPAITQAHSTNDVGWILTVYRRGSYLTVTVAASSAVLFLLYGQSAIYYWTKNLGVVPSFELLLACVAFMVVSFWNAVVTLVLNGLSEYKGQATYGLIIAVGFAAACGWIDNDYGKEAIVWINTAGFALRCLILQISLATRLEELKRK